MNHVDCRTAEWQGVFSFFMNTLKKPSRCTALVENIQCANSSWRRRRAAAWSGQQPQVGLQRLAGGRPLLAAGHAP
jgi:hypothetical protein